MKLSSILGKGIPTLSFEVFPPKTSDNYDSVNKAALDIAALKPDFISVTYGAGGGTSEYTLDIAHNIEKQYGVPALAHLTCISSSKEKVNEQIAKIKSAGIENVMALRGDIPKDKANEDRTLWSYNYASELIEKLANEEEFCIGAACYPEVHPESKNQKEDIRYLKAKVDAGVSFLTTQMFFDNNLLYNFLYKIREAGITVPVVAGIMPITNAIQVKRAIELSGCHMPQRFKAIVDRFGNDPKAMVQAGIAYATDQIIDLLANGVDAVHVYSMNKPAVAKSIQNNLSQIIPIGRQ